MLERSYDLTPEPDQEQGSRPRFPFLSREQIRSAFQKVAGGVYPFREPFHDDEVPLEPSDPEKT